MPEQLSLDEANDDVVRRTYHLRAVDEEARAVEFVCSTEAVDSWDEVVEQSWKLERYKGNPVVLYGHNRSNGFLGGLTQEETLPIGRAEDVRVEMEGDTPQLKARLLFATEKQNPFAERVFQLIQAKMLNAVSVGFRPGEVKAVAGADGKERFHLSKNELFEISVVPIPANAEAVALRSAKHAQLRRLAGTPKSDPPARKAGPEKTMDEEEIKALQAAREKAEKELGEARATLEKREGVLATVLAVACSAKGVDLSDEQREDPEKAVRALFDSHKARGDELAKLEQESAERDVDELVGKKITPAARAKWLKLRLADAEQFSELTADLPDLGMTARATERDDTKSTVQEGSAGDQLAELVSEKITGASA